MARDRRSMVTTLAVVGVVFAVLSLAQGVWRATTDRPAGPETGLFAGGVILIVIAVVLSRTNGDGDRG